MRRVLRMLAAALAAASVSACASRERPAATVLGTPAQIEREAAALRVLATPEMQSAERRVRALYANDAQAASPAGQARLQLAARSITVAAIYYALGEDTSRPHSYWTVNAPHQWFGLRVPGSGFGIDNPDNVYMNFTLQGGARYELTGRWPDTGPVELHLEVRDGIPGMNAMSVEGGAQLATLRSDRIERDADGGFRIAIDSDSAAASNHLAIPDRGAVHVGVRQLFTDWGTQDPVRLELRRIPDQAAPAAIEIGEVAVRAAEILDHIAPYWLAYNNQYIFSRPANELAAPRLRLGGRGLSTSGHYRLHTGEALLITLDPLGAASLGVQISDVWGVAYDYVRRTSSLNNAQARPNVDGTFTFVIAAQDPGVWNWLDSGGHEAGIVVARWQVLPNQAAADAARGVRQVEIVALGSLRQRFADRASRVDGRARAAQRYNRQREHERRLWAR